MDGLIPFVLKALKKKKAMKHYRSLSSSGSLAHIDVTELSPQAALFMTPQHPRAPRWHDGDCDLFMTPQRPRAPRWLDEDDDGKGEPATAAVKLLRERAKSSNPQRLPVMEALPLMHALGTAPAMGEGAQAGASLAGSVQEDCKSVLVQGDVCTVGKER